MNAIPHRLLPALLGLHLAMPAAGAQYDAGVQPWIQATGNCNTPTPVSDPVEASASTSLPRWGTGGGSGSATADASAGGLHVAVSGGVTGANGAGQTQLGGCTLARQTLDDVVVSGPAGDVMMQFSVRVVGTLDQTASGSTNSLHSFDLLFNVHGGNGDGSFSSAGSVDALFTSDPTAVTVGQPFTMSVEFQNSSYVQAAGGGGSSIDFDGSYDVAFPVGVPVFTLPPGYTANSADGGIVDNMYGGTVGVAMEAGADDALRLLPPSPNPMGSRTTIRFRIPRSGPVDLTIYDVTGRRIRQLVHGPHRAGDHSAIWTGTDDRRTAIAPGVYLYRLVTGDGVRTGKVVRRARD